jgi:PAS domain S-box-containing protein
MNAHATAADFASDYQALFELSPLPSYLLDDETLRVLAVNQTAVRRYGFTREEFLSLSAEDICPADDHPRFRAAVEARGDGPRHFGTWRHRSKSGEVFTVNVVSQAVLYGGRAARFIIAIDAAEALPIHDALFDSGPRLQALFDNALDAILVANDDARIVDANPAACELLKGDRAEIIEMKVQHLVPPEDLDRLGEQWRQLHVDGSLSGQVRLMWRDGELCDVEYRAVANFVPGLHLCIARDVTEVRRADRAAEAQLRQSHEQLRRISARAQARREQDRLILARDLHDQLGQELTGLKIGLHWLGERLVDGRSPVEDLTEKVAMLMRLVDETIVSMRRIASELRPPVLDKLGLMAAIEWHAREFQRGGIRTVLQLPECPLQLDSGRSTMVFRIFQEALTNVARHANATRVTVTVRISDSSLTLIVADDGSGVEIERAASTDSLGLGGMRERALALGGTVDIGRAPTRGTIVTLRIPIAERRAVRRDEWP